MTIHEARQQLSDQLSPIYDDREATAISDLVMEYITGWQKIDRIINKAVPLSLPQLELLKKYAAELLSHKPVQYVLQEAWFCGMKFYVDENVLIPRPETEELVEWTVEDVRCMMDDGRWTTNKIRATDSEDIVHPTSNILHILDIGTGSGCIPVALKKKLPGAVIYSCDVSEGALEVARRNALSNNTDTHFLRLDFLDATARSPLPFVDIIISNPPYIPSQDKKTMQANVVDFEPHLALFVRNSNPLLFYEAITDFAREKLRPGGNIFVEIHEALSSSVEKLFSSKGFSSIEIKNDMQGKPRMLKATMLL